MNTPQLLTSYLIGFLLGAFSVVVSHADEKPATIGTIEATAKKRQDAMRTLDEHMKSLADIVSDGGDPETMQQRLRQHTKIIQEIVKEIPSLFPEGSDSWVSRAKPDVWQKPGEFQAAAQELNDKLKAFAQAVEQGDKDKVRLSYKRLEVRNACTSCHDSFRKQDKASKKSPPPRQPAHPSEAPSR